MNIDNALSVQPRRINKQTNNRGIAVYMCIEVLLKEYAFAFALVDMYA